MTFRPELKPQEQIPNLGNYLTAVEHAKEEHARLSQSIKMAMQELDSLKQQQGEALQEKLKEIELLKTEALKFKEDSSKVFDEAVQKENLAKHLLLQLSEEKEALEKQKLQFADLIKSSNYALEQREFEINSLKLLVESDAQEIDFLKKQVNEKSLKHAENVVSHEIAVKNFEINKQLNNERFNQIEEYLRQARLEKQEAQKIYNEHLNKFDEFKQQRKETEIKHNEIQSNLAKIKEEKASLNNLIIESKRAELQTAKQIAALQRVQIETNLKIADLNDLKNELSKQE